MDTKYRLFTDGHDQYREIARGISIVEKDEQRFVEGKGIVFNEWTELIPGRVRERVMRSAVEGDILTSDIQCCFNHDKNQLLGRTSNGTMTIEVNDSGAFYRAEIPETSYGKDMEVHLKRGNIFGSSFVFIPNSDGMEITRNEEDGVIEITHNTMSRIRSIDPVFSPQYKQTTVMLRGLVTELEEIENALLDHDAKTYTSLARARYEIWGDNLFY